MKMHHLPNIITGLRMALVWPIIFCIAQGYYLLAFVLFLLAGISDALDGFLARQCHWQTVLGAFIDPMADKLLLVSCFIALSYIGALNIWVTMLLVLRDFVIMAGAGMFFYMLKPVGFTPTLVSKLNTLLQLALIILLLYQLALQVNFDWLLTPIIIMVVLTTIISMFDYLWVWSKKAQKEW